VVCPSLCWTRRAFRENLWTSTGGKVSNVHEVVERAVSVLAARPSALVTDIDGTLSRIVLRPEDAYVSDVARAALRRLVARLDLVAVVTGRENDVARRMLGVEGITYVGSYAIKDGEPPAEVDGIASAQRTVETYLPRLSGVTLETKDVSFALHYRNSPDPAAMRRRLLALLQPIAAAAGAKLMEGKLVVEIAPRALPDKGTAFASLMETAGIRGAAFAGDDLADTAIFREIRRRRARGLPGLSIGVVDDETPAAVIETTDVQLRGVDEVEVFLAALADRLEARFDGEESPKD
jgi:trehalose 6-phosphate phosphatase